MAERVNVEVTYGLLRQAGDIVERAYSTGKADTDPIIPDLEDRLGDVTHLLTEITNDIWRTLQ